MKLLHFLVAAAVGSASAASAQTTPTQTSPNTANPSAVPSGTAPVPSNPNGAVSAGEVFTAGAPSSSTSDKRATKRKDKRDAADGKAKTKTKM